MTHSLHSCPACAGFLSPAATICLHCDAPVRPMRGGRLARAILGLLGSGVAAVTLMACYGGPGHVMNYGPTCANGGSDADHDGECTPEDCNDTDRLIFSRASESSDADGVDQNCDGADGIAEPVPVTPTEGEPVGDAVEAGGEGQPTGGVVAPGNEGEPPDAP
jgi:hypothetical protein